MWGSTLVASRKWTGKIALLVAMPLAMPLWLTPPASADPTADLKSAVAGKRGACPALQPDPVLDQLAQRANGETQAYTEHSARFIPFEDPMPLLRQMSYPAGKSKLLAGYGEQRDAIYGAVLFGWQTIPDCSYTKYGADVLTSNAGYTVAAVVLVGD